MTGRLLVGLLVAVLVATVSAASPAAATVACPPVADACVFVDSSADSNARDDVMTLREALMLVNLDLAPGSLAPAEQGQVVVNTAKGLTGAGADRIYFDPGVFQSGSPGRVIHLAATAVVAEPVVLSEPPVPGNGPGGGGVLGMGWDRVAGAEVPAAVVIDGAQLGPGAACLRIERAGAWVRGMTLANCARLIEVVGDAVAATLIGTNGDNVNDEYEAVIY